MLKDDDKLVFRPDIVDYIVNNEGETHQSPSLPNEKAINIDPSWLVTQDDIDNDPIPAGDLGLERIVPDPEQMGEIFGNKPDDGSIWLPEKTTEAIKKLKEKQ